MAILPNEKIAIRKVIKECPYRYFEYQWFFKVSNRKSKYTDNEVLAFLIDDLTTIIGKETETISYNLLEKYVNAILMFIEAIQEKGLELDTTMTGKIITLKDMYLNRITKTGVEENLEFSKLLDTLRDSVVGEEKTATETSKELFELITKISEYEKQVHTLELTIERQNTKLEALTREHATLERQRKTAVENKNSVNVELDNAMKQVVELQCQLEISEKSLHTLQNELVDLHMKYNAMVAEKNSRIDELEKSISEKDSKIDELGKLNLEYETVANENSERERLTDFIFNSIAFTSKTAVEIVDACNLAGFNVDIEKVKEILVSLEERFSLRDRKKITIPTLYKVQRPNIITGAELQLNAKPNSCLNILLLADFHTTEVNEQLKEEFYKMYDYSAKNGIDLIVNVGDFLGLLSNTRTVSAYNDVFDKVKDIPTDPNVVHVILGGNHDKLGVSIGGDLLQKLCDSKEGLCFLGYDNATIKFDEKDNENIIIHHPDKRVPDTFDAVDPFNNGVPTYLDNFYSKRNRDKTYIDIFGHLHAARIDTINSSVYLPSYLHDRFMNGAYHAKIHFDENKNIKYITFIQLMNNQKLNPVSETTYQKLSLKPKKI